MSRNDDVLIGELMMNWLVNWWWIDWWIDDVLIGELMMNWLVNWWCIDWWIDDVLIGVVDGNELPTTNESKLQRGCLQLQNEGSVHVEDHKNPPINWRLQFQLFFTFRPFTYKVFKFSNQKLNEWMDRWMDGWMDGWMNGWTDGWMDGWTDGRTDGWIYYVASVSNFAIRPVKS